MRSLSLRRHLSQAWQTTVTLLLEALRGLEGEVRVYVGACVSTQGMSVEIVSDHRPVCICVCISSCGCTGVSDAARRRRRGLGLVNP